MTDLFTHFDAWEPLMKARKAKGLDKWDRLKGIAEKLQGKDVKAIAFTCSHPSHNGEPIRHLLGSVEGNLHFLLGYGNPQFHLAPYHWQIIDPNTTDEEAQETFGRMHHPSNPVLWSKVGLDVGEEGDTAEGEAHPMAKMAKVKKQTAESREAEAIKVISPTGNYVAYPSEGLVEGEHNGHVYRWDLVKDTFFTAQNPQLVEAMDAAAVQKSINSVVFRDATPDKLRMYAAQFRGELFEPEVWPLVKSRLPVPGSILKLETNQAERVYGVITTNKLEFYGRDAAPRSVSVFDRVYKSFDLTREGNVPPSVLSAFMIKHFKINPSFLSEATQHKDRKINKAVFSVEGQPSPGFDAVSSEYVENLQKSIVLDGDTIRLVVS